LITVVVSRNLRIQPSASMSVSAFSIACCWALLETGSLDTGTGFLGRVRPAGDPAGKSPIVAGRFRPWAGWS